MIGDLALLAGTGLAALPMGREMLRKPMGRQARKNAPGQFADLTDGRTHFDWIGPKDGPVAVCVHGLTTPSFVWGGLAPHLARMGYRVLVYDLFGRGYSDRPRRVQTPEFFADQLSDLLRHQNVGSDITVLGYSMGAVIATAFAAEDSHRPRRLVLIAPAGMGQDLGTVARFATDWPLLGDWLFHMGWPRSFRSALEAERSLPSSVPGIVDLQIAELQRQGYVRSVLSSLRHSLRQPQQAAHHRIARDEVPVAAIWGRDDTTIPISAMGTLAQWNRSVQHEVIDGAGHGLVYTHTDDVAAALERVLA
ncbi:alpha/beta hydrolase [Thalassococcus sp. CAU 1522]|uniref:Alpha/beta hydrolase n=1 Tax=Thalassococcus arenae TaxID=2851652 RepID=A0ABS6N5A7_9RHOB|nr:alpha/beta hydrolase [Thalassococcus arenae]MBV2359202.1 alpha/beta hydrolase [Thalassococcus arenae]